ncbi:MULTISPECIES: PP2C family protein-serine/threonine phosphatase [unclassified Streptomyces]|uniref:PP2C family protein-serine/threonine phosphatase n=1 Tax=unclassified Streptomyces TaxID=2593676 RepID=UPI003318D716
MTHARSGLVLSELLRASHSATFEELPALLLKCASRVGVRNARLYVADLQQEVLREVTGVGLDAGAGGLELRVDSTVAGRSFMHTQELSSSNGGGHQYWLPLLDGTERLGVMHAEADDTADAAEVVRGLASLMGLMLVSKRPNSDSFARLTRSSPMSVSAEMQWTLIPPRTFSNDRVTIACAMEPAYDTAGDAFDYAIAEHTAHIAVFDAMGHDTTAGLTANLAVATSRSLRRQGADPARACAAIETVLLEQFHHDSYVTGIMADLDMRTGTLSWVNSGHLPPVLVRGGRWAATLDSPPTHPMGTDLGLPVVLRHEHLEPGDRVLLYTDGVTEARNADGEQFGRQRFVDFIIRHQADGLPVPETLRRLIRTVLDHHGRLQDDATVLFCEWRGNR